MLCTDNNVALILIFLPAVKDRYEHFQNITLDEKMVSIKFRKTFKRLDYQYCKFHRITHKIIFRTF